ncbi:MAG TPA: hypothetical protein VJV97_09520 [Gemmatimonadaceae bacterium]|nr:hypothetical protein [Gemmatimonadaceae bacterium]
MTIVRRRFRFVLLISSLLATTAACVRPRPENQVMRLGDDFLASGSTPLLRDSIPGDAILAGGDVTFSGYTGGDYVGAGGRQGISGRVHGSLRAAGGHVAVYATVDRNATIGGGDVIVDSSAVIGRNAYLIGGNLRVYGAVRGGLLATGGKVEINGVIGQDVEVASGTLLIGPRAQIAGNLRYRVKGEVHIDPAAHIAGKVTALPVSKGPGPFSWLWTAGVLLMGVVAILVVPGFIADAADRLQRRPGRAILVGIAVGILGVIAIFVAAVTVVGLPLALLASAVYLVFAALSEVPVAVWLGGRILHERTVLGRQGPILNFFIGALILLLIGIIPFVGGLVRLIATCIGFGAILMTVWAARERQLA